MGNVARVRRLGKLCGGYDVMWELGWCGVEGAFLGWGLAGRLYLYVESNDSERVFEIEMVGATTT